MKQISDALAADTSGTASALIFLGPGEFQTNGYYDGVTGDHWEARSRMKIVGSGIDVTKITLVGTTTADTHYYAVGHALDDGTNIKTADFFEISNLTINCNLGSALNACGAIRVLGKHAKNFDLKVINWGTKSSSVPCHVISALTGYYKDATHNYAAQNVGLQRCIATNPANSGAAAPVTVFHVGNVETAVMEAEVIG
ncbi:MAG TPA: hypothetical protein VGC95_12555 [Chitinophagaceae bacterium]